MAVIYVDGHAYQANVSLVTTGWTVDWSAAFTPTAGNALLLVVSGGGAASITTSVTGWALVHSTTPATGALGCWVYYKENCAAADTSLAFKGGGGINGIVTVREYSGGKTSGLVDANGKADDETNVAVASTSCSTGTTGTRTTANGLGIAIMAADNGNSIEDADGGSWSGSWTNVAYANRTTASGHRIAELAVTSTGALSATYSGFANDENYGAIVIFDEATAAGTTITCGVATITSIGNTASIYQKSTIACSVAPVVVSGVTATIYQKSTIACSAATVAAVGNAATIYQKSTIACGVATVTVNGTQATIDEATAAIKVECSAATVVTSANYAVIDPESPFVGRPIYVESNDTWASSTGGRLYDALDEETPDDGEYVYADPSGTTQLRLNNVTPPSTDKGHVVSFRAWHPDGNGWLNVILQQGSTNIASYPTFIGTLPAAHTTYTYKLTEAEAANITDYSNLNVVLATLIGGAYVSWVEFRIEPVVSIEATPAVVAVTGTQATIKIAVGVEGTAATIVVAGQPATIYQKSTIACTVATVDVSGTTATIDEASLAVVVECSAAIVTLSGRAACIAESHPYIARPVCDGNRVNWTSSIGGPLYSAVDEDDPDNSDYVVSSGNATVPLKLNPIPDPGTGDRHLIQFTAWNPSGTGWLSISLREDLTDRWGTAWTGTLPSTPTLFQYRLTAAEANSIVDYSNLSIFLWEIVSTGTRVGWARLIIEQPTTVECTVATVDVSGTTATITEGTASTLRSRRRVRRYSTYTEPTAVEPPAVADEHAPRRLADVLVFTPAAPAKQPAVRGVTKPKRQPVPTVLEFKPRVIRPARPTVATIKETPLGHRIGNALEKLAAVARRDPQLAGELEKALQNFLVEDDDPEEEELLLLLLLRFAA